MTPSKVTITVGQTGSNMLEGGVTLESLFEPTPKPPNVQDVGLDDHQTNFPGIRHDLKCGECGAPMQLLEGGKYPTKGKTLSPFYGCTKFPACRGSHGAHPDGSPKGTPANKETRLARIRAHTVFDQIWKDNLVKHRGAAYNWMREVMHLSRTDAHIARFNKEQCDRLVVLVYRDYPALKDKYARLLYDKDPFDDVTDDDVGPAEEW